MAKTESFANFYFKKVGLGEACGCAERAIDMYEFDRQSKQPGMESGKRRFSWKGFALKYGLVSRHKPSPDAS